MCYNDATLLVHPWPRELAAIIIFLLISAYDSEVDLYITSLYWTISTMTSTGYGDVSAHTLLEMVYTSTVMVVGKLMFAFILANISSTLSNAGVYRVQYDLQIQSVRVREI